jgi:flagellar hook-associated protein 1 FlgK
MQSDGTATVLLGGQSPLVQGITQNNISLSYTQPANPTYPNATPSAQLLTPQGQDVTSLVTQGTIGAGLTFANTTMPALLGSGSQQGSLNQLAQGVADTVNNLLTGGQISSGPPAVPGVPLFTYSAAAPTGIAGSLAVSSTITGSQLAAIDPGTGVANGNATALANLATTPDASLNNLSFSQYYGSVAADVGQQAATAASHNTATTAALNQAQSLRAQVSGVSLNQQATQLLQFQESYQASAQLITTINTITQSLLTVMQQASSG